MANPNPVSLNTSEFPVNPTFGDNDWIRITSTGGNSTSNDWYTVNWNTSSSGDPNQFWVPTLGKYLNRTKLYIPAAKKPCLESLLIFFDVKTRTSLDRLFNNTNDALTAIRGFRPKNDQEKRVFLIILRHVYMEEINV